MNYEIVTLEEKNAVGISAKTSNTDPRMGEIIGGMWSRFFSEGIYDAIPEKANEKALGIYADYEGAEYRAIVACETAAKTEPCEYETFKIPAGRYAKFVVRGDMHKAVADAWSKIWAMDLPRSFVCDFEEYQDDRMDDAEIHIYIGLKEEK